MKKIFFLIYVVVVLMPAFSDAACQTMAACNQAAFNAVYSTRSIGDVLSTSKLGAQVVVFLQKPSRRIADPIITYETLRNAERLALRPIYFVNDYPNLTLLILTTILLFLTIARRKQLEHAPVYNLSYCNAVR